MILMVIMMMLMMMILMIMMMIMMIMMVMTIGDDDDGINDGYDGCYDDDADGATEEVVVVMIS